MKPPDLVSRDGGVSTVDPLEPLIPVETPPVGRSHRLPDALRFIAPFAAGWAVTVALFYPGHANGDTAGPYLYALGRLPIDNWQPTTNVILNWVLLQVWQSPASILIFQTGLLWAGLAGVAMGLKRLYGGRPTPYLVVIGFLPIVFNYAGALIKDTYSVAFTTAAIAALVLERSARRHRGLYLIAAVALLFPAYLVKIAVLPIVLALIVYIALRLGIHRGRWSAVLVGVVSAAAAVLTLTSAQKIADNVTHAREAHIQSALQLFDLSGITHFSHQNVLGDAILPANRLAEMTAGPCYDPGGWDVVAWYGQCSFVYTNALPVFGTDHLQQQWVDAIKAHPRAYLEHRADHLWSFSIRPGVNPFYYDYVDPRLDWKPNRNVVMDGYDKVIGWTARWPFMRPIFWEVASLALLGAIVWRRRAGRSGSLDALVAALAVGNLGFYALWAIVGVAHDFRYSYTVVVGTLLCVAMLGAEWWSARRVARADASPVRDVVAAR